VTSSAGFQPAQVAGETPALRVARPGDWCCDSSRLRGEI